MKSPRLRGLVVLAVLAALAASCSVANDTVIATTPTPEPVFELTSASMPAINPGGLGRGSVVLEGTTIEYVTVTPDGFTIGDTAPVFFALAPGAQDIGVTREVVDVIYQEQALRRGWVVVSPAVPDGLWSDGDNADLVPELVSWMRAWIDIENGKPHIGGMSNGGLSAFHIALQDPGQFQSVLAFPGFPRDMGKIDRLADVPVRMWVGGEDASWLAEMQKAETELLDAGGDVQLWVLRGETHILSSTQNGVAFFDELESAHRGW